MERRLLRVMLGVVCLAGVVLTFAVIGHDSLGSAWVGRLSFGSGVVLVAALLSLAAAQAWDRGARALAAGAVLLVELAAMLALLVILFPRSLDEYAWAIGVIAGAALLGVALCGLVVVQAEGRDRWIGRAAGACFVVVYLALVVWSKTDGRGSFSARLAGTALTLGTTATAAYSIRARLARLALVTKPPTPPS